MKRLPTISTIANALVIIAALVVLFSRNSAVGRSIHSWIQTRRERETIGRQWNVITSLGARLDESGVPTSLVEFSDYECPFCEQANQELTKFLHGHPNVGIQYRHLPLQTHPAAEGAARAAICAERQGRFRQMHERLFSTRKWAEDQNWMREATAAGISDTIQFSICLTEAGTRQRLQEDVRMARTLKISGTPTFVYRTGLHAGVLRQSDLVRLAP